MDGLPSPLQAGSPALGRGDSQDYLPSPLQVGSPAVDRNLPFSQRASQDRLSQLFPSRPATAASQRPTEQLRDNSKRLSYPSPLLPAAEPAYKIPQAPAPPSFAEPTAYEPRRDPFDVQHPPAQHKPSRSQSILERISSMRSGGASKRSKYNQLHDDDDSGRRGRLREVDEEDDGVGIGCDISGFEGPIALRSMGKKAHNPEPVDNEELDPDVAGLAAEFHRLESNHKGTIGGGMTSVIETPYSYTTPQGPTHKRGISHTNIPAREEAQKEAEKTGEILVVTEAPVDISNLGGGDYETGVPLSSGGVEAESESKKSYYFPEDPEQPSWRPMSMHWGYITLLIVLALALAALQEFLCQLSIKKAKEGGGLLHFMKPQDLTMTQYFSWKYAPTLILVSYGVLWQISDFEVKRLEPYYQLSKRTGATAAESINNDYITYISFLSPIRALRYRQWAVFISSVSYLIAGSLVPVLQSASVNMYPDKAHRQLNELKYVRIDPRWSRPVTASLCLVAVLGAVLLFQLRRKSGLLSDPKGIAGIAAMATRSHILNDFRGMDIAPHHVIHKQLRNRRYILHKSALWQGEYIRGEKDEVKESTDPRPLMLTLKAGISYICFMILIICLIPVFMFVEGANKATEKLPWLLTAIATSIKLVWGTIDGDIRLIEPFYILSRRNAPPSTLTLDYTGTIPGYLCFKAFMNKHFLVALVGFGAIMTEVLTVCVSSFSVDGKNFVHGQGNDDPQDASNGSNSRYNTDETFKSFWVSFALVIGILVCLVLIACLVFARRAHKFMPRQVGTIASVLAYIHQSHMLVSFVDTERMDSRQMTRYLENTGKTYGLGWFSGRDGEDHCGIDEEPLKASYKWGVDFRESRMQSGQVGAWEHYETGL